MKKLGTETAIAFWQLLLPHAITGGALAHTEPENEDEDGDDTMQDVTDDGWRPEYVDLWFAFLNEKGGKGVSKDSWMMVSVRVDCSAICFAEASSLSCQNSSGR